MEPAKEYKPRKILVFKDQHPQEFEQPERERGSAALSPEGGTTQSRRERKAKKKRGMGNEQPHHELFRTKKKETVSIRPINHKKHLEKQEQNEIEKEIKQRVKC
jgi:polynucleotide 5'-kinase involved in rRNA processing